MNLDLQKKFSETEKSLKKLPERCAVCGNDAGSVLMRHDPWRVLACTRCGLGVLDPRPSEDDLQKLYEADYFLRQFDAGLDPSSAEFQKRIQSEDHRVRFIRKAAFSGKLLDMGCGYGYFLEAARKAGFDGTGYEISQWAARYASDSLGIPIAIGPLSADLFAANHFDIISMWHFLEHTSDPNLTIASAAGWLKEDGALVIDVPNYEGMDAQKSGESWVGWALPYHLYHFSPFSLKALLKKHGFTIYASKDYHSEVVKKKLGRIPILRWVARPIAKLYSGTSIAVVARRKNPSA
jgi:SAM-dependent methyltransferase